MNSDAVENAALNPKRKRTGALERCKQICEHLMEAGDGQSPYEIAKSVKAPLSTVYSVCETMVEIGFLERGPDGTLWLGARLFHYGLAFSARISLLSIAREEMRSLSNLLGETVQLCGRDGGWMVVVDMFEPNRQVRVSSRVGSRMPLNWTASGRLLVSHLPYAERRDIFESTCRPSPTRRAELDLDTLCKQAQSAVESRLSVQMSESDEQVACIAAPILDMDRHCDLTISVVLPSQRAEERLETYSAAVREAANRIEKSSGGQPFSDRAATAH